MKKCIILLVLVLMFSSVAQAETLQHVVDQAAIFSASERAALEKTMQSFYDTYGFDTLILTTNDSRGQSAKMYAADFYEEFRSDRNYPNGLVFSFNFDIKAYDEVSFGIAMELFSDQGDDALDSILRPHLDDKDYYGAMISYLSSVEKTLSRHSTVDKDGKIILSTTPRLPTIAESLSLAFSLLPFVLIAGLIIGFISAFVMRGKLNLARPQSGAAQYTNPASLRLRDSSEIFLYQTVTRTKIQQNTSSGGGSGGSGGGRFTSSSGRSYGSRGGKL